MLGLSRTEFKELIVKGNNFQDKKAQEELKKILLKSDNPLLLKELKIAYSDFVNPTIYLGKASNYTKKFEEFCISEKIV